MKKDELFFIGQKVFVEKDGNVLVLINKRNGEVDFPGGKILDNEDLELALRRELEEELGPDIKVKIGGPVIRWVTTMKYGKNIGKRIFLVGFRGEYLSGKINLSSEHSGYKWVNKKNYKQLNDGSDHFMALERYFDLI